MSYLACIEEIKKKKFEPVYYFYGVESFMIEALKQALIEHVMPEEDQETNLGIYDLEEVAIQEVIHDAETYPFLGERKLIFAINADFLLAKPSKTEVEHYPEALISYLDNPAPYSILVVIAPYEKVDERKKVVKQMKKKAKAVACEPVKEWNIQQVITSIAKKHGVHISKNVIDYFVEKIGTNLMLIHSEMEKLALYVGEGNTIRLEDAEIMLSNQENSSALKLVDAIIAEDLAKAIEVTRDLQKLKEDAIALLALIASQFRTLLQVKILRQKGYNQKQMANHLKIHPYVAKLAINRQAKFEMRELQEALLVLSETDSQIKNGQMDKTLAFELLLYRLITNRSRKAI